MAAYGGYLSEGFLVRLGWKSLLGTSDCRREEKVAVLANHKGGQDKGVAKQIHFFYPVDF